MQPFWNLLKTPLGPLNYCRKPSTFSYTAHRGRARMVSATTHWGEGGFQGRIYDVGRGLEGHSVEVGGRQEHHWLRSWLSLPSFLGAEFRQQRNEAQGC